MKFLLPFLSMTVLLLGPWLTPLHAQSGQEPIRLIIRSDDMGCSHATNVGMLRSYTEGITTSIEIMVPTPWFPEAVAMLRTVPDLDVGIHLTLTSEWSNLKWRPLTQAPSLTDDRGYFYPMIWPNDNYPPEMALKSQDWKLEEMEQELRAQIELALRELPRISHLTAHMGCMSISEEAQELFRSLAEEYGLDIHPEDMGAQRFPKGVDRTASRKARIKDFIQQLDQLTPGLWLYVAHPAEASEEQAAIHHTGYADVNRDRSDVLAILTSPKVQAAIKKKGIQLVSYADLRK